MQSKNINKLTTLASLAAVSFVMAQPTFAGEEDFGNEPVHSEKFYPLNAEHHYHHPIHHLYHHPLHHYHHLQGTNTSIHFIFNPRLDTTFDSGAFGGAFLNAATIPLKGANAGAHVRGNFDMTAQATQLGFKTKSHTGLGEVDTHVEVDFANTSDFNDPRQTDTYTPRLTFAYFDLKHFRAGQDTTNFFDLDAIGSTVDYNTAMGGFLRQAQIRYGRHVAHHHHWSWAVALERPATDYTNETGVQTRTYDNSGLPDATLNVRWQRHNAHATVRGLVRGLRVKDSTNTGLPPDFHTTDTAFGVGVSGRYFFVDGSNLFAQFNMGDGIGRYIIDANGQSAFFNDTTGQFQSQRALFGILGAEVIWPTHCHNVRSNFIWTHMHVDTSGLTPTLTGITQPNKQIDKLFVNALYEPIRGLDLGLEYEYVRRETVANFEGHVNRLTAAAVYHF